MITPPKDKPASEESTPSKKEDQLTDEAVAGDDSEIDSTPPARDASNDDDNIADLNSDADEIGLNQDQGEEFL